MKKTIAILVCIALAGCASRGMGQQYRPIVDTKGKDLNQYDRDLGECQAYAAEAAGAGEQAAAGAVGGAIFGALLAVAAGGGYNRGQFARVGALTAGVSGAAKGETDQRNVIRTCLNNRGYSVLQ
jgi:outer membrane lipoprotein SlyB